MLRVSRLMNFNIARSLFIMPKSKNLRFTIHVNKHSQFYAMYYEATHLTITLENTTKYTEKSGYDESVRLAMHRILRQLPRCRSLKYLHIIDDDGLFDEISNMPSIEHLRIHSFSRLNFDQFPNLLTLEIHRIRMNDYHWQIPTHVKQLCIKYANEPFLDHLNTMLSTTELTHLSLPQHVHYTFPSTLLSLTIFMHTEQTPLFLPVIFSIQYITLHGAAIICPIYAQDSEDSHDSKPDLDQWNPMVEVIDASYKMSRCQNYLQDYARIKTTVCLGYHCCSNF